MFTLIQGGELFAPEPRGRADVLSAGPTVVTVRHVDARAVEGLGPVEVLDAAGAFVLPGLIDPHEHLIGGSGEGGFSTASPEIFPRELARAGITTVVGLLGTDSTARNLAALVAKALGLREEEFSAFAFTGGYSVPPETMLGTVRRDIMFITPIIGLGEVAIADDRATEPGARELARLVSDAAVGGRLAAKAGVTHFHVGPGRQRVALIRALLDDFDVDTNSLYPTHCNRTPELFEEAVALTKRGVTIDIDTTEQEIPRWLREYRDRGGDPARLTISTDADASDPGTLWSQIQAAVTEGGRLEELLPLVTRNTARVLRLESKGRLTAGGDADAIVVDRDTLAIRHVVAAGRVLVRDGDCLVHERFLPESSRRIRLDGDRPHPQDEQAQPLVR